MHQRKYVWELISKLGLGAVTPLDPNAKLTAKEYDDYIKGANYS